MCQIFSILYYAAPVWLNNTLSHQLWTKLRSVHYWVLRAAARDHKKKKQRADLNKLCMRATPKMWSNYIIASTVIKITRNRYPKYLEVELFQGTTYQQYISLWAKVFSILAYVCWKNWTFLKKANILLRMTFILRHNQYIFFRNVYKMPIFSIISLKRIKFNKLENLVLLILSIPTQLKLFKQSLTECLHYEQPADKTYYCCSDFTLHYKCLLRNNCLNSPVRVSLRHGNH